jgi:hypothetical protein
VNVVVPVNEKLLKNFDLQKMVSENDELKLANFEVAQKYLEENTPHHIVDGKKEKYPLTVELEELKKYGIGIFLFFKFLKLMGFAFMIMFVFALPSMIIFSLGGGVLISFFYLNADCENQQSFPSVFSAELATVQSLGVSRVSQPDSEFRLESLVAKNGGFQRQLEN